MLQGEDFLNTAEADKYGQKLGTEAEKKDYHLEDESEGVGSPESGRR